jgi:hypothetical protein
MHSTDARRKACWLQPPATSDTAQLADAWQQVCACLDSDIDIELRALYDSLLRQIVAPSRNGELVNYEVAAVRGGR